MAFKILLYCNTSREKFNGNSFESTTPLAKFNHLGITSSQFSIVETLLTYSFIEFFCFLFLNKSNGARFGTNRIALNSNSPSTEKC